MGVSVGCYSIIVSESLSSTANAVPLLPHGRRLCFDCYFVVTFFFYLLRMARTQSPLSLKEGGPLAVGDSCGGSKLRYGRAMLPLLSMLSKLYVPIC